MDFEAFDEGVLLKRLIADGASVPVGTPIAIIGKAGDDIAKLVEEAKARAGGVPRSRRQPRRPAKPAPGRASPRRLRPRRPTARPPRPQRSPRPHRRRCRSAPRRPPSRPRPRPRQRRERRCWRRRWRARLATDLGIDLRNVQGTGPGGRIVERDVKAAAEGGANGAAPATDWHAAEEAPQTSAPRVSAAAPLPAQIVPDRRSEARPARPPRPRTSSSRCR